MGCCQAKNAAEKLNDLDTTPLDKKLKDDISEKPKEKKKDKDEVSKSDLASVSQKDKKKKKKKKANEDTEGIVIYKN
jgi:hypothetical protein